MEIPSSHPSPHLQLITTLVPKVAKQAFCLGLTGTRLIMVRHNSSRAPRGSIAYPHHTNPSSGAYNPSHRHRFTGIRTSCQCIIETSPSCLQICKSASSKQPERCEHLCLPWTDSGRGVQDPERQATTTRESEYGGGRGEIQAIIRSE